MAGCYQPTPRGSSCGERRQFDIGFGQSLGPRGSAGGRDFQVPPVPLESPSPAQEQSKVVLKEEKAF